MTDSTARWGQISWLARADAMAWAHLGAEARAALYVVDERSSEGIIVVDLSKTSQGDWRAVAARVMRASKAEDGLLVLPLSVVRRLYPADAANAPENAVGALMVVHANRWEPLALWIVNEWWPVQGADRNRARPQKRV